MELGLFLSSLCKGPTRWRHSPAVYCIRGLRKVMCCCSREANFRICHRDEGSKSGDVRGFAISAEKSLQMPAPCPLCISQGSSSSLERLYVSSNASAFSCHSRGLMDDWGEDQGSPQRGCQVHLIQQSTFFGGFPNCS